MSEQRTRSQIADDIKSQLRQATPSEVVNVIATQIERAEIARVRIDVEGIVVRDMKGSVIQHPALEIEAKAGKMIVELMTKYRKS